MNRKGLVSLSHSRRVALVVAVITLPVSEHHCLLGDCSLWLSLDDCERTARQFSSCELVT